MCLGPHRFADLWILFWKSITVSSTLYKVCWNSIPRTGCWTLMNLIKDNHLPHYLLMFTVLTSFKMSILTSLHSCEVMLLGNRKLLPSLKVGYAHPVLCSPFHRFQCSTESKAVHQDHMEYLRYPMIML